MRKNIIISCLALMSICYFLGYSFAFALTVDKSGNSDVKIKNLGRYLYLKTDVNLTGYNINCSGDRLILWGHPIKINESNPQDSTVILFDLSKQKILKKIGFSKGVFDVDFLTKSDEAYIGSDPGFIINTNTGGVATVPQDFVPDAHGLFEQCVKDKGWKYDKYEN